MSFSPIRWPSKRPRRVRKPISCKPCRESKLRCDRQTPCATCRRRGLVEDCAYNHPPSPDTSPALAKAQPSQAWDTAQLLSPRPTAETSSSPLSVDNRAASDSHARWDEVLQRPTDQVSQPSFTQSSIPKAGPVSFPFAIGPAIPKGVILAMLPSKECCDYLITKYFQLLSPLFHILHSPTFQQQYNLFQQSPLDVELSWLALLFTICSVTLNTMEDADPIFAQLQDDENQSTPSAMVVQLRNAALMCLSQDQFLIRHSLSTLEALLILIYGISHNDGVERAWVLLGMALNIAIALRCNVKAKPPGIGWIEVERRRRCWAGVLLLHTNQAIIFRDVNVSSLLGADPTLPADVNDTDIQDDRIHPPSRQPTQMSMIMHKLRLFQLSSRICDHLSSAAKMNESRLIAFDAEIAAEQAKWDATFLLDGQPSILDSSSYAHWCILQHYAHQLYLLIHRAFCLSRPGGVPPRAESQMKCIASGAALLEIHRQFCEVPRLRNYRWYVYGMMSFCALHGAAAMASCLLMGAGTGAVDEAAYRAAFDANLVRFEQLQGRSTICAKAYPILRHLQSMLNSEKGPTFEPGMDLNNVFDEWIDTVQWLDTDPANLDIPPFVT
ncbi:fungal-specific transcription factor domain-containing protein [Aspergillus pseudoustus]|uniref:Fungal-specific transcription factor domain-containing protein n=1 Tax=Aspergillus pseudoustus TaxID=1810923 RepID=A0ABR4KDI0_9EURO